MNNWTQTLESQFANSNIITTLLNSWNQYVDPQTNIDNFYDDVFNILTAVGWGLDTWGIILGTTRYLQLGAQGYFGFQGQTGASGVGFGQGIFYTGETITTNFALSDDGFRVLLLAKAAYNISNGTIPAINSILRTLFGPSGLSPVQGNSYCTDNGNMTMTYTFGAQLTPLQFAIVSQSGILPRPCGVLASVVQLP